jgi:phosphoglycerate dehydrogenase-like enzyme
MAVPESLEIRRVLFLQKVEVLEQHREGVAARLAEAFPDVHVDFASEPAEVPSGGRYDAVIAPTLPWLPEALGRLARYRWIHFLSAGVEKIWDMDFDKAAVIMTKSSGVHGQPMSEYAIGAMLYFAKQFGRFDAQARERRWERTWLDELTGRTVVVLGMGHVGSWVARRAKAFDMRVIGVQRRPRPADWADEVLGLDEVGGRLHEADYLVVCLPLTAATEGIVNAELLGCLKKGAVLVDISRGGVVQERAVIEALHSGRLKGAALDVFERQPLPPGSPLWSEANILVTPHVSGTSPHYMNRAIDIFIENARALEAGAAPLTLVDPDAGY